MYTDSNGIAFLEDTDPVDALHATVNAVPSSVSNWINSKAPIWKVANSGALATLAVNYPPSLSNPLYAHQLDTGVFWRNIGSGWVQVFPQPEKALGSVTGGTQSIPSGAWTTITAYAAEPLGRKGGMVYSGGAFTVPTAGIYIFNGSVRYAGAAAGRRGVGWSVNGTQITEYIILPASTDGGIVAVNAPTIYRQMNAGDAVTMMSFQNSGSANAISAATMTVDLWR